MKAKDFKADAVLQLTNTGGIKIMIDDEHEYIYYRFHNGQTASRISKAEILHGWNEDLQEFDFMFLAGTTEYWLNEFMSVGV